MKKLSIILTLAVLISGCAIFENPVSRRVVIAGAVSSAIRWGVPVEKQAEVARQITAASQIYNSLAGPEGIPTVDQFTSALDKYLPNDPSKPLAETALIAIYSGYYPEISKKAPKEQLAWLSDFLVAASTGAAPFLK